jgi:hypothetical protein
MRGMESGWTWMRLEVWPEVGDDWRVPHLSGSSGERAEWAVAGCCWAKLGRKRDAHERSGGDQGALLDGPKQKETKGEEGERKI